MASQGAGGGEWRLRVRCPQGAGVPAGSVQTLTLAAGGATTLAELRAAVGEAAGILSCDEVVALLATTKATALSTPPATDECARTVSDAGIRDRDTLIIEKGSGELSGARTQTTNSGAASASASTRMTPRASTAAQASSAGKKAKWGAGHALGSNPSELDAAGDSDIAASSAAGKKPAAGKKAPSAARKNDKLAKLGTGRTLGSTPRLAHPSHLLALSLPLLLSLPPLLHSSPLIPSLR